MFYVYNLLISSRAQSQVTNLLAVAVRAVLAVLVAVGAVLVAVAAVLVTIGTVLVAVSALLAVLLAGAVTATTTTSGRRHRERGHRTSTSVRV